MNRPSVIMSIVVALAVYSLLHYFVYARMANGPGLSAARRLGLKIRLAPPSWQSERLRILADDYNVCLIGTHMLHLRW